MPPKHGYQTDTGLKGGGGSLPGVPALCSFVPNWKCHATGKQTINHNIDSERRRRGAIFIQNKIITLSVVTRNRLKQWQRQWRFVDGFRRKRQVGSYAYCPNSLRRGWATLARKKHFPLAPEKNCLSNHAVDELQLKNNHCRYKCFARLPLPPPPINKKSPHFGHFISLDGRDYIFSFNKYYKIIWFVFLPEKI